MSILHAALPALTGPQLCAIGPNSLNPPKPAKTAYRAYLAYLGYCVPFMLENGICALVPTLSGVSFNPTPLS